MRKAIILAMTMIVSVIALAQEDQPVRDYTVLKGLSFGVGVPIECLDLPGAGVTPCTGFGLYDLDMVLPVEVRFGKYITDRWYLMGSLTYHISLAGETACIEPAIRAGYNFGHKPKSKKK